MRMSILFLLVVAPCASTTDIIPYGPGQCLALLEGERLVQTTEQRIDDYAPLHGVDTYQVPIHKSLSGGRYDAFFGIGVGFQSDEKVLFDAYLSDERHRIISSKKTLDPSTGLTTYRIFSKVGGRYNHKYIFTIPEPLMTLVVNEVSADSAVIASLFYDTAYAQKRRRCE